MNGGPVGVRARTGVGPRKWVASRRAVDARTVRPSKVVRVTSENGLAGPSSGAVGAPPVAVTSSRTWPCGQGNGAATGGAVATSSRITGVGVSSPEWRGGPAGTSERLSVGPCSGRLVQEDCHNRPRTPVMHRTAAGPDSRLNVSGSRPVTTLFFRRPWHFSFGHGISATRLDHLRAGRAAGLLPSCRTAAVAAGPAVSGRCSHTGPRRWRVSPSHLPDVPPRRGPGLWRRRALACPIREPRGGGA